MNQLKKLNLIKLDSDLVALEYDITYDPIEDKNVKKLPSKILKKIAPWNKKTRMLKKILYPSIFKRLRKKLDQYLDKKIKEYSK